MSETMPERKGGTPSHVDWGEFLRNRWGTEPTTPGLPSHVDWEEVMRDRAVTEVTTMTLSNTAEPHTEKTDAEILENARRRAPRLKYLLSLARAEINAEKY